MSKNNTVVGSVINKLRSRHGLSQEAFADLLGVSRQAVQKWETGNSLPDMENIIAIAKRFHVSTDTLLLDNDLREKEEMMHISKLEPDYPSIYMWELFSAALHIEYQQCIEEGLDVSTYKNLFEDINQMPPSAQREKMADALFEIIQKAPIVANYAYVEPSGYEDIVTLCKAYDFEKRAVSASVLKDKVRGAWLGRICGCLLGQPVECIMTDELIPLLKDTGNYPMHRYIRESEITEEIYERTTFPLRGRNYADVIECAPADDDLNYTVLYQKVIELHGRDFTPTNVASVWMDYQPKRAYCTAERVAYCNFVNGFKPPASALYKNPYREWIGAQIRADYFGYINPGDPVTAAEMAWRDASISHTKNGIYGEMFVAAMLACAAVTDKIEDIILGGLSQIPVSSRLYEAVLDQLNDYRNGLSQQEAFEKIHKRFDEYNKHDAVHTISNALIVTASLLYGAGDFGKSICMSVETGFDTDCNGATVGSILGMRNGSGGIGSEWTAPLKGMMKTMIFGMDKVSIEELVEKTMTHMPQ